MTDDAKDRLARAPEGAPSGPHNPDPRVGKVLTLIEESDAKLRELRAEPPRPSRRTRDENDTMRAFWAGYLMGLRNAAGILPVVRTHYNPAEGYLDV